MSGLPSMGEVPWGTHLCQFYRSVGDLCDALVPFFKTGLDRNEACIWVTSEPLRRDAAYDALRAALPDVDVKIAQGQLEILDYEDWYLRADASDSARGPEAVVDMWLSREAEARKRGFAGLRLSGNTFWLQPEQFGDFAEYEAKVHAAFQGRRILALCCYFLPHCGPDELIDVLRNHQCALVQRDGEWEVIQSATLLLGRDRERALVRLHQLTEALGEARTVAEIVLQVTSHLSHVFGADHADFALFDSERDALLRPPPTDAGPWDEVDPALPLAHAFRTGAPVWLGSRGAMEARFPAALLASPELATLGCLPLRVGARRIGVVSLGFNLPRVQSAAERALLEDYVRHVGLSLDRALHHEACTRAQQRLQLLADATDHIAHARLDLHEVLETIVQEVARPGFADCCVIHLASAKALDLGAIHHLDAEAEQAARPLLERTSLVLGEGIVGGVAASGRPLRISGREAIQRAGSPVYREYLERYPIAGMVVVPMRTSGSLLGTLAAYRTRPPGFAEEDQQLIEQLAARAALAIENAQLYERAQRERARAEVANRAKDEFLAMLGHELRNPLSPILTAVQLMRLKASDTLAKERTTIERQVHRMVRLVDDLLDVSRVTRGKIELKRVPVELASVISDAIETASPMLEARAHRLDVSAPSQGLLVEADPARLSQVIANLLTNAAKYTPSGGYIRVEAKARPSSIELCVRDNGVGINPELLPRVFELFVQGKQASDRAQGGLGLGLAIAHSLVELHGGTLRAHSDGPGRGSAFTLELPCLGEAGSAQADADFTSRRPVTGSTLRPKRILVVDDNLDAAHTLADALADIGHDVRVAHDGPSALEVAASFRPDLALLDIGLPVMDGYELAGRLRAMFAEDPPKLIAVTGYGQQNDRMQSKTAGFQVHLVKPVDLTRLTAAIDAVYQNAAQDSA